MIVCVCKRVSDRQIKELVTSGAGNLAEVRHALGVASQCGSCSSAVRDIINDTLVEQSAGLFYQAV